MDIASCLQCFENSLSTYAGEDPLDPWDKFVDYLEQMVPADSSGMSQVFESLVQRFLNVERYANDVRYVKHCIRCAGFYSDPLTLFSYFFGKGIGTRTAALYVAWAQLFEQRGANEQAEAVFHKAMENQAQPADTIISEYRQFQARTRSQMSAAGRNPLQNSHLTNQISSHREPQNKVSTEAPAKPPTIKTVITISRSETSGAISSSQGANVHVISEYLTDVLVCEGSELCFEEVRAEKYFRKLREKQEREQQEQVFGQQILSIRNSLEILNQELQAFGGLSSLPSSHRSAVEQAVNITQQPSGQLRPSHRVSSRRSLGLRLHTEPTFIHEAATAAAIAIPDQPPPPQQSSVTNTHPSVLADRSVQLPKPTAAPGFTEETGDTRSSAVQQEGHPQQENPPLQRWTPFDEGGSRPAELHAAVQQEVREPPEAEERLNTSQGGTGNLSHVTPNTSLGFVQATPSRVLPSPTVNTREALDVIMDMFQAPTLLDDPFSNTSALMAEREAEPTHLRAGGVSSLSRPPPAAMFTVFQDDCDKENGSVSAPPPAEKSKPIRALAVNPVTSKPNDTPSDLMPDESTMWGTRYNSLNSLAACPNSTSDFAMLAQFVSTPFTHKTPLGGNFFPDKENIGDSGDVDSEAFTRRPLKKLSPIMEQSPLDETTISQLAPPSQRHGTIVGEGLAVPPLCLTSSSTTMVQPPPPAVLSFRDQTICPPDGSAHRAAAGPGWDIYTSPEAPPRSESSAKTRREPFTNMEDLRQPASPERVPPPVCDVPMSPDGTLKPDWLNIGSPEVPTEPDLDAFLSPCRLRTGDGPTNPERPPNSADVPMSPMDAAAMSPEKWPIVDVSMNAATPAKAAGFKLVSNPWDDQLISELLSALTPPLTAHPHCVTWQCNVPAISPKTTISMGNASLRVDCILGQGAFATVYQATDPATSARMVLKVQKPANPWEFYINTQLDARMQPRLRHLYGCVSSAHLFHNGSVLLAELHNYGTLLNAVNIYKTLSGKLMPQPLVLYFTVCILNMVEQLHAVRIVHADIKPDNFMLGERFLENKCFEAENVDHGLVLIDLGQSIDMELFPQGTAFTVSCLTSGFQCTEMLSGKPWNYQTDYFGIAGTVHCMLFGTYMQVTNEGGVWKTNGMFRRNPHGDLWAEFFHTLLNVPDCNSLPDLQGLRHKLASVLQRDYGSKLAALKSRLVVQLLESHKAARR